MIHPTIGRVVLFNRPGFERASLALVSYVHSDRCINIGGFDHSGHPIARTSVQLLQDNDPIPEGQEYACWMPYQKEQAAKTAV